MYGSCNRVVFKFCSHDQKDVVSSAGQGAGGHPDRGELCDWGEHEQGRKHVRGGKSRGSKIAEEGRSLKALKNVTPCFLGA